MFWQFIGFGQIIPTKRKEASEDEPLPTKITTAIQNQYL